MGEPARDIQPPTTGELLHETSDARIRPLAYFLAGLGGALVVVALIIWGFFAVLLTTINDEPVERRTAAAPGLSMKEPPLQVSPRSDIDAMRERDDRALKNTAWIDRERGLARVPIETAMEMVAKDGVPRWPPPIVEPSGKEIQSPPNGTPPR
jgi:hypothetical protein